MVRDAEMTFMEHLEELRSRIFHCLFAIVPAAVVTFFFAEQILVWLTNHARDPDLESLQLVAISPPETILAYIKIAVVGALFIIFPYIMFQAWKFIEPGLKDNERKFLGPFLASTWFTFILGGLFAYYAVLAVAVPFLANFGEGIAENTWSLASYVGFALRLILVFGIVFELPVVIALLSILGLVSPDFLKKYRVYAYPGIFILGALLTPPDPLTQILLAVPLMGLYEFSILVSRFFSGRREAE